MDVEPPDDFCRDALTGLGTRTGLALLEHDLERGAAGAVIFCDLDNLVLFNHENGHFVGDRLIRLVAAIFASFGPDASRRYGRHAYRLGGDEFMILLPGEDLRTAETLAEEARTKIKRLPPVLQARPHNKRPLTARFAIGAWADAQPTSLTTLLREAERILESRRHDSIGVIDGHS